MAQRCSCQHCQVFRVQGCSWFIMGLLCKKNLDYFLEFMTRELLWRFQQGAQLLHYTCDFEHFSVREGYPLLLSTASGGTYMEY